VSNLPKRDDSGQYPTVAWPGCYPLCYLDREGNELCAECASREIDQAQGAVAYNIYWEGPPITCSDCGETIESAYGDPEEETR
jgi:hypothetical protein